MNDETHTYIHSFIHAFIQIHQREIGPATWMHFNSVQCYLKFEYTSFITLTYLLPYNTNCKHTVRFEYENNRTALIELRSIFHDLKVLQQHPRARLLESVLSAKQFNIRGMG